MNNLLKMTGFVPVILGVLCACQSTSTEQHNDTYIEDLYEALPFDMPLYNVRPFPTIKWIFVISVQKRTVRH